MVPTWEHPFVELKTVTEYVPELDPVAVAENGLEVIAAPPGAVHV